jgi:hypothetical protein
MVGVGVSVGVAVAVGGGVGRRVSTVWQAVKTVSRKQEAVSSIQEGGRETMRFTGAGGSDAFSRKDTVSND